MTEIKTEHVHMIKLLWPPTVGHSDAAKARKAVLAACRRVVHRHAPVELACTGFQLMPVEYEDPLYAELAELLEDTTLELDHILVHLPAPDDTEHSARWYEATQNAILGDLSEHLNKAHDMLVDEEVRRIGNAFKPAVELLDNAVLFWHAAPLAKVHTHVVKLSESGYAKDREGAAATTSKLIAYVDKYQSKFLSGAL